MKLIFVTRKIDRGDARTGFVFMWLEKLSVAVARIEIICLECGDDSGLPANATVYSMGKEKGKSRSRELLNYWRYLRELLPGADGIFIHMHPIYAIAAWPLLKLFGKKGAKMVLWYTHKSVDLKLRLATWLVDAVLTASKESFRLTSHKVKVVGHGIDLEKFHPVSKKQSPDFRIVSIGRISPVKSYEILIKAAKILRDQGEKNLKIDIYGGLGLPTQQSYFDSLVALVRETGLEGIVEFKGKQNYEQVQEQYREGDLFVNLSQTGSMDKSVLEAAASGTLVLTSNEAFLQPLKKISPLLLFESNNPNDLAGKILYLKNLPLSEREKLTEKLRFWVEAEHNLENLVKRIGKEFSG
jgi:glycosyltransferase involved in cell wall biosynthesis